MDSEAFQAPPTTTASLSAYFRRYGASSAQTAIELEHFQGAADIEPWLQRWREEQLPRARAALEAGLQPVVGFSFYTWNAAEFLALSRELRQLLPQLTLVAGGPHVQQAQDYLGEEPFDVIFLGEAEVSFQEFLDCPGRDGWHAIDGLVFLRDGQVYRTAERARCMDLDTRVTCLSAPADLPFAVWAFRRRSQQS